MIRFARLLGLGAALIAVGAAAVAGMWKIPLEGTAGVSGTFAEFRSDHVHSGLDLSTNGRTGVPVRAVEAGKIERIRVSQSGFGRCLYIRHADGTLAVYAHLLRFTPETEERIWSEQTKKAAFELDLAPEGAAAVEKGALIGYSGNSGTTAPHLHLELRGADGKPEDPAKFLGMKFESAPVIGRVVFYPLTADSRLDGGPEAVVVKTGGGKAKRTVAFRGTLGVGVEAFGKNEGNRLGVRRIILTVDGEPEAVARFERFSYDDYRRVEGMYDRKLFCRDGAQVFWMFAVSGESAPPPFLEGGAGALSSGKPHPGKVLAAGRRTLKIEAEGFDGKKSAVFLGLDVQPPESAAQGPSVWAPVCGRTKASSADGAFQITTGERSYLYGAEGIGVEEVEIGEKESKQTGAEMAPRGYRVTPAWGASPESAVLLRVPGPFRGREDKVGLYARGADGKWSYLGGKAAQGAIAAKTRFFGLFAAGLDDRPPRVEILCASAGAVKTLEAAASDGGSGLDLESGVLLVDGERCFPYFNRKSGRFVWGEQKPLAKGRRRVEFFVKDRQGNEARVQTEVTVP